MFVINKSIIFLTSNNHFCPTSPLSILLLSAVKKSESGEKYAQIKHHLQAKVVQFFLVFFINMGFYALWVAEK